MQSWMTTATHSTTFHAFDMSKRRSMPPIDTLAREDAQKPKSPSGKKHFKMSTSVSEEIVDMGYPRPRCIAFSKQTRTINSQSC